MNAIEITIEAMGKYRSETASAILVHALAVPDDEIKNLAARSLLYTGTGVGKIELVRNINDLSCEMVQEISQNVDLLRFPIRECLGQGNTELSVRALETIKAAGFYGELPTVLQFIRSSTGEWIEQIEHLFEHLVNDLYDDLQQTTGNLESTKKIVESLQEALAEELSEFQRVKRPRLLIESLMILSHPGQSVAREMIRNSSPECLLIMWNIFRESRHPGILRFLADSLKQKYIHAGILSIISERKDFEFHLHFIDSTPQQPSANQERNYKNLDSISWLKPDPQTWNIIPQLSQGNLIRLIDLLGFSEREKIKFYERALQFGSVEARKVAAGFRTMLIPERYEQYIKQSLNNSDPSIEAWAVSELKYTHLKDKSRLLIERLDSSNESVQEQARESLGMFDLQQAIELCESATPSTCLSIAELLLKIDPNATQELSRELANPMRTRRLQAAKAAHVMGLQNHVQEGLIELLYDSDPIIRRTVIDILAEAPTPQIVSLLMMLLDDPNPRVRSTTTIALKRIRNSQAATIKSKAPQQ